MAEADRVVVELVAENDKFDANVRQSSTSFTKGMDEIVTSAGKAEKAHGRLTLAANNSRIGMLEMQHVLRGSVDQFAAGAPITQIFAQHIASVAEAASLSGGALGSFGAILGGPVGLAVTAATAVIATLIAKHHEEGNSLDDVYAKLVKHKEQTTVSQQADDIWSHTLDGLIERSKKLNDELSKRLQTQTDLQRQQLSTAQSDFAAATAASAKLGPDATPAQLDAAEKAIRNTSIALHNAQVLAAQDAGEAIASITQAAKVWADQQLHALKVIQTAHPELAEKAVADQMLASFNALKTSVDEAAGANVDFNNTVQQTNELNDELLHGTITVDTYQKSIRDLAQSLHGLAEEAKNPITIKFSQSDNIKKFKEAVFGAEGTGRNQMGSSAAGFGQFTKDTWLAYFNKLFPDKAELTDAAKLDFRNIKDVATAVIDKATDDYVTVIKSAGQAVTKANLYAVHVLGAGDAKKFFGASPDQSVKSALGGGAHANAVVAGNPFLGGTVAQAQAAFAKRIGDSSAAVSSGMVAIAAAVQQEKERQAKYLAEKDEYETEVIDARKSLATTAEQVWAFEVAAAIAAHKHTEDQITAQEVAGKLLPQEAVELKKINDEREKYVQQLIDQRLRQAQFASETENLQRGRDFQTSSYEAEGELLQSQEGLVRTAKQRKTIEDRLIDLQFEEERLKNQYIIDWAARVQANKDATDKEKADAALAAQIAQMHQNTLPQRQSDAHQQNAQSNASPLQAYFNSIPQTAQEIDAAFEQIAANGLQTFNDALASAIVNFTSLRDVARTVLSQLATDLIKFALQQIELHTLGQLFATTSTATTIAQMAAIAAAAAPAAAMVSLATYGTNAIGAQAGIASTVALATILGAPKALGGRISGPGTTTSDSILTPSSVDEYMIRASAARAIGYDTLDYINRTGRIPNQPSNDIALGPGRGGGFSGADISQLRGIVADAIKAMPDINLYPTVDSGDLFSRGIKTGPGSRAVLAHVSANSSHYKTVLAKPGS
jgi:hypothetical protein